MDGSDIHERRHARSFYAARTLDDFQARKGVEYFARAGFREIGLRRSQHD